MLMSQQLENLDKKVEIIREEIALLLEENEKSKARIIEKEAYLEELLSVKDELDQENL